MPKNDAYVQVPADGSGKLIDHSTVATSSGTVYRQRIVLAKDDSDGSLVDVNNNGEVGVSSRCERKARFLETIGVTRKLNKLFGRRGL